MHLTHTPKLVQRLFPHFIWRVPTQEKVLYLTFDDGPIPHVTPWVLEQLRHYKARATFFCVGDNVKKHPDIYRKLLDDGHAVGNHTFNHLNGWGTDNVPYFLNVRRCAHVVQSSLFRPPYGRLTPKQSEFLRRHYHIILWDVLSGDFDKEITGEECLQNVTGNARKGSIVVFHDSLKAWERLEFALPRVLEHYAQRGYRFGKLDEVEAMERMLRSGGNVKIRSVA